MRRLQPRLLIPLAILVVAGCGDHDRNSDRGPETSQTREVTAFEGIEMTGAARLEVTVGEPLSLVVEGRERSIERVHTEVRDGILHIEAKPKGWVLSRGGKARITLRVSVPKLNSLELEGGNDVVMKGFKGGTATFHVAGATRLKAEGQLEELDVRMQGAGHADLARLLADRAKVTVDGVGSVVVYSKDTLDATMNGVGAILYTGNPRQVNTRMNGLGTIGQQRAEDANREGDEQEGPVDHRPSAPANPDDLKLERESPAKKPTTSSGEVI